MDCTKLNCPMQAGTVTENCGENCPWRTTAKITDLISRAAAIARIDKCVALSGIGLEPVMAVRDIKALISVLPTVDAVPVVHGNWKIMSHGFPPEPCTVCSNCGLDIDYEICKRIKADSFSYTSMKPNYCPNCGAKMDGERRESE